MKVELTELPVNTQRIKMFKMSPKKRKIKKFN